MGLMGFVMAEYAGIILRSDDVAVQLSACDRLSFAHCCSVVGVAQAHLRITPHPGEERGVNIFLCWCMLWDPA